MYFLGWSCNIVRVWKCEMVISTDSIQYFTCKNIQFSSFFVRKIISRNQFGFFLNLRNLCSPPRNVYSHAERKYLFNCSFTMCRIMSNSIQISFHINSHLSYLLSSAWSQQTDLLGQTMCDDQKCHRHLCECYLRFDYFCFFFK